MDRSAVQRHQAARAGMACLSDALRNHGTAFTHAERMRLALDGLLPPRVESLEEQAARVLANVRAKTSPIEKFRYLSALQGSNETLFYRVVLDHLEELLPVVYTPTVGQACVEWSALYERPHGLYISSRHRGRIAELLRNGRAPGPASSSSPTAAAFSGSATSARTAWAYPSASSRSTPCALVCCRQLCLPVPLDVGTDNEALRNDPFYLGERRTANDRRDLRRAARRVYRRHAGGLSRSDRAVRGFQQRLRVSPCCGVTATRCAASTTMCRAPARWGWPGLYTGPRHGQDAWLDAAHSVRRRRRSVPRDRRHRDRRHAGRRTVAEAEARQRCLFLDSKGLVVETAGICRITSGRLLRTARPCRMLVAPSRASGRRY